MCSMIPRHLRQELKKLLKTGRSLDDSLAALRSNGASVSECIVAVKEATACDLIEAKRNVEESRTWRDAVIQWDDEIRKLGQQ
jgi:orotate phosphoribosyltransferase